MKLHKDPDGFIALLHIVSENTGIRLDVLEKDYYISLILKELSEWQNSLPVYFKGGTALYKALGSIRRFSEDIDLTVCIDDCSNSEAKRRLEKAANGYHSLQRTSSKGMESNRKGSITSVYDYESVLSTFVPDPLQRFSHVKVEATSFTVSESFAPLIVAPLVFEKADGNQKAILENQYDVSYFSVNTILLERIFVDKVFASEFYYQRREYFDVSKHIYDLSVMSNIDVIQQLLSNSTELTKMMAFKRREESNRIGSDLSEKPISNFMIFEGMNENVELKEKFISMQDIYIFNDSDKIDFHNVIASLSSMRDRLLSECL
ncbi:MAG: nucleotidyl transferase AbiEii/AbiGii toxin family protein [Synergistaceae bacterium]|nr:nucleotidyl transferase AbiEii/AbiGii toxin family protein [Synergistaceae bacterium]